MTLEDIRTQFDWSNTKPDLRDRVSRAVFDGQYLIETCTGSIHRAQQITWCNPHNYYENSLDPGTFRFDAGGWACDDESVLATRIY